jgi:uncharacterized protein DUF3305
MLEMRFSVSVVMERLALDSRWASERWQPAAVVPMPQAGDGSVAATRITDDARGTQWRFDGLFVELHRSEGEGYWLNLDSCSPKAFVMWRPSEDGEPAMRPHAVTLSYNEAARMLDAGEQVEGVPLDPMLLAWMRPFVEATYTPAPRRKVRRNDPFERDGGRTD